MGFLTGKKLLITGVLSNRSIAYGIAKACHEQGATLAFTYVGERFEERVKEFAADFGSNIVLPCDVAEDSQIEATFTELAKRWDGLDGLVHSIGFAPREAIAGEFLDGLSREAFRIARIEMIEENKRIRALRDRLLAGLKDIEEVYVNGDMDQRVAHNLNISFNYVEGESMLMALKDIAISSGSACTSASLEPSYVLRALGRNDELAHSSIRFTIGRFTTEEEVDFTVKLVKEKIAKLRELSPLWEMYKDGIDLSTIQWAAH